MKANYFTILLFITLWSCGNDDDSIVQAPINQAPVLNSISLTIDEFPFKETVLTTLQATDEENDNLTYSLVNQSPSNAFRLDGTTVLVDNNQVYNYTINSQLTATIEVNDGTNTIQSQLTVTLNDIAFPNDGLMAYYPLGLDNGTETINGYNGSINGTVTTFSDRSSNADQASFFNNGYLEAPSFGNLEKNITISAWLYNNSSSGFNTVVSKTEVVTDQSTGATETGKRNYVLRQQNDQKLNAHRTTVDNITYQQTITNNSIPIHNWTHVTLKIENGTTWNVYIDGVLEVSEMHSEEINLTDDAKFYIGGIIPGSEYYIGGIDDVRIYRRALSNAEILDLANDNF